MKCNTCTYNGNHFDKLERVLNFKYRIKRFFSGVHACVNGADAITNFT